jgi:hypothetical protein
MLRGFFIDSFDGSEDECVRDEKALTDVSRLMQVENNAARQLRIFSDLGTSFRVLQHIVTSLRGGYKHDMRRKVGVIKEPWPLSGSVRTRSAADMGDHDAGRRSC